MAGRPSTSSGPPACVYCRRNPVDPTWRPFCSERCKLHDLGRWADGSYSVRGEPIGDDDTESETEEGDRQK